MTSKIKYEDKVEPRETIYNKEKSLSIPFKKARAH